MRKHLFQQRVKIRSSVLFSKIHRVKNQLTTQKDSGNLQAAGRLKHFDMNWEEITNDLFILDIVQGFEIVFLSEPVQNCLLPPVQMNKEEVFLVDKEIQERLQKGQGQNSL